MDDVLEELAATIRGHGRDSHERAEELVRTALEDETTPEVILESSLVPAMADVGRRFRDREIFVPQVLVSSRAMQAALRVLEPLLTPGAFETRGHVVIGTVKGDVRDIGTNLVAMLLRGSGFVVTDLGINVPMQRFADTIEEVQPEIVGLSALLTTTMMQMESYVEEWVRLGLRGRVKVMVGGAPVTSAFARKIGADAYGRNASDAVDAALALVEAGRGGTAGERTA